MIISRRLFLNLLSLYGKNYSEHVIKDEGCWNYLELFKMQEESKKDHQSKNLTLRNKMQK